MAVNVVGILSTLFLPGSWRSYLASRAARNFDRRYGTDTRVKMAIDSMNGLDPRLARHAVQYEASAIPKFQRALAAVQRSLGNGLSTYTFVDFGSGKGLVVMLASRLPFRRVHGVEMSHELHAIAQANVQKFAEREPRIAPITLTCADALTHEWPDGNVVAYLYNPFDAELTGQFIERLLREAARSRRAIVVVYVNPAHRELFDGRDCFQATFSDSTLVVYEYRRS